MIAGGQELEFSDDACRKEHEKIVDERKHYADRERNEKSDDLIFRSRTTRRRRSRRKSLQGKANRRSRRRPAPGSIWPRAAAVARYTRDGTSMLAVNREYRAEFAEASHQRPTRAESGGSRDCRSAFPSANKTHRQRRYEERKQHRQQIEKVPELGAVHEKESREKEKSRKREKKDRSRCTRRDSRKSSPSSRRAMTVHAYFPALRVPLAVSSIFPLIVHHLRPSDS